MAKQHPFTRRVVTKLLSTLQLTVMVNYVQVRTGIKKMLHSGKTGHKLRYNTVCSRIHVLLFQIFLAAWIELMWNRMDDDMKQRTERMSLIRQESETGEDDVQSTYGIQHCSIMHAFQLYEFVLFIN